MRTTRYPPFIHSSSLPSHTAAHSSSYCRRKLLRILCIWLHKTHKTAPLPVVNLLIPRLPLPPDPGRQDTSRTSAKHNEYKYPFDARYFAPLLVPPSTPPAASALLRRVNLHLLLPACSGPDACLFSEGANRSFGGHRRGPSPTEGGLKFP